MPISVTVNGLAQTIEAGSSVADLLRTLQLTGTVAVERNREIVPRARHGETVLTEGDTLEVVTFVGGG